MRPPRPGEAVREAVRRDPLGAELRCSLFAAALQSYRRDSALRPFPSRYGGADAASKDFEALVSGTRPRRRSRPAAGTGRAEPGGGRAVRGAGVARLEPQRERRAAPERGCGAVTCVP